MTLHDRIGQHYSALTPAQQRVAKFITETPAEFAFSTVERLAELIGVSPTTIVRTATAVGYSGYSEMQAAAREALRTRITPVLRLEPVTGQSSAQQIIRQTLEFQAEVVRHAAEALDDSTVEQVINALTSARRVFVTGFGTTHVAAFYFAYGLAHLIPAVQLLDRSDLVSTPLAWATGEDLLVAFSFARYRRITVQVVQVAKERGVPVVVFTDSAIAPVYPLANWALICPYEQPHTPVASPIGPMAVADAILASLSSVMLQHSRGQVLKVLGDIEGNHTVLETWERP